MQQHFTLEYWLDDGWYVGKLQEVPGIFSQGETLDELEDNVRDAYRLMIALGKKLLDRVSEAVFITMIEIIMVLAGLNFIIRGAA